MTVSIYRTVFGHLNTQFCIVQTPNKALRSKGKKLKLDNVLLMGGFVSCDRSSYSYDVLLLTLACGTNPWQRYLWKWGHFAATKLKLLQASCRAGVHSRICFPDVNQKQFQEGCVSPAPLLLYHHFMCPSPPSGGPGELLYPTFPNLPHPLIIATADAGRPHVYICPHSTKG